MAVPHRVQLSRRKGWRLPANTVVVARPSKHGNPFRVLPPGVGGRWCVEHPGAPLGIIICGNKEGAQLVAVREFRPYAVAQPPEFLSSLRGKNLACWCAPGEACHADVLLELANREAVA